MFPNIHSYNNDFFDECQYQIKVQGAQVEKTLVSKNFFHNNIIILFLK